MASTPPLQTPPDSQAGPPIALSKDNAAKMAAVNELLGAPSEETAPPERAAPEEEADKTVSELLAEAERPPDSAERQETVIPPKTLDELAERLSVKVEDLYAIEFPHNETGEGQTLGQLKDLMAQDSDFAGRELEFEERRVKFGNDQAKARQELELVLKSLPEGAIKPEVLATARKEREVMLDRESARVLDVIPEWSDDEARRVDLLGIGEHMVQYGFDKGHVDQIVDHRMLRYMRDNLNRKTLVEKALAGVKPVKEIPKGKSTQPARKKETPKASPASSTSDQLDAIDNLLNVG